MRRQIVSRFLEQVRSLEVNQQVYRDLILGVGRYGGMTRSGPPSNDGMKPWPVEGAEKMIR
jgi:hypothetical protein